MSEKNIFDPFDFSPPKQATKKKNFIPWRDITPSIKLIHHKMQTSGEEVLIINAPKSYIFDFYIGDDFEVFYEGKLYQRKKNTAVIHSRTPGIAEFRLKKKKEYEFFSIAVEKSFLIEMFKNDKTHDYINFFWNRIKSTL